ncbi:MAG: class I adenylate-forming enzyme family protein [Rhizomicrobium sp.]
MIRPPVLPRISDYAAWQARHQPDADALVLGARRITYAELDIAVDRTARALLAAGVKKGDRVATLQNPTPEFFIAFLATASIGAIWVGLNPKYRVEELLHVVKDAEPVVLLTRTQIEGRSYADEIAAFRSAVPMMDRVVVFDGNPMIAAAQAMEEFLREGDGIAGAELSAAREACGGRDPCLIVYTSGSTGKPKGALLHHEGIVEFSLEQNRLWPVDPQSMINYFPINHIGCVIDCSSPCFVGGGKLVFLEHFSPSECLALMAEERITIWGSVPTVFRMQLTLPDFARYDLGAVQLILWEGAAMPSELLERLIEICPRMATNYGMTETTSAITIVEPTSDFDILAGSVGVAFPGVEIRLADGEDRAVSDGTEGEVQTRSRYNLLGYWRRPDATKDAFTADGFFKTGDLAVRRPDGRYRIVGRLKEMFKSGGYNVYPREVEAALEAHPAVGQAAVVSIADPLWDEVGVAYVVPREAVSAAALESHCRAHLANYKVPKRFVITGELPLLPIGKVDRRALKTLAEGNN